MQEVQERRGKTREVKSTQSIEGDSQHDNVKDTNVINPCPIAGSDIPWEDTFKPTTWLASSLKNYTEPRCRDLQDVLETQERARPKLSTCQALLTFHFA